MFLLRSASISDLNDLLGLSRTVSFINLPPVKHTIEKILKTSEQSFQGPSETLWDNTYLFVLEDTTKGKVVGASMIHAQHGTENEPHFFLKVAQEKKFSTSLNTGFIHGTLKLGYDSDGPTEIGGLVLASQYRNNEERLGKQISFVRFLYMGKFPNRFKQEIHSELMPPLTKDGNSPLWEAVGRRFLNMDYQDADRLSRSNKEFILSLFPSQIIYETLLPLEARNAIGQVGKDTIPVKNMLEKIGFKYINEVDPFDGGPHYRAQMNKITPIKNLIRAKISFDKINSRNPKEILVELPHPNHAFAAAKIMGTLKESDGVQYLYTDPVVNDKLRIENNTEVLAIYL